MAEHEHDPAQPVATARDADIRQLRRRKNIAVGLILFGLCALFYLVTIVRMGGG